MSRLSFTGLVIQCSKIILILFFLEGSARNTERFEDKYQADAISNAISNPPEGSQVKNTSENGTDATSNALQRLESQMEEHLCFSWFFNRPKLNRLEIRTAFSMSVNMLPFCFCTFPVTLNAIAIYWCIRLQTNCPTVFLINPYLTDLFLIHTIYNPLMYIFTSREFKRALIHLKDKLKCKICCN